MGLPSALMRSDVESDLPTIAIIGRPNVGKSSLFNRLIGRRVAIVDPTPGVTRDRIEGFTSWRGRSFRVIDTGGLDFDRSLPLKKGIQKQVDAAIAQADALLFVVDATEGPMPLDADITQRLRHLSKPVFLAANKVDNEKMDSAVAGFYQLGLGEVYPISALQGRGIGNFLDAVVQILPQRTVSAPACDLKIAILGKPNVGKSSFVNALIREPRMIVDERPGTTRDAVDVLIERKAKTIVLTDTAGIRRKKTWESAPEFYSVARARACIQRCDVAILIMDAMQGISQQDRKLAQLVQDAGKGMVLCLNKWDLVRTVDTRKYAEAFFRQMPFLSHVSLVYASALQNRNIDKCIEEALEVHEQAGKSVPTKALNNVIQTAQKRQSHPMAGGKRLKIFFAAQTGKYPPQFTLFVSDKDRMSETYLNYMKAQIRNAFGFLGVPIRLVLRNRH